MHPYEMPTIDEIMRLKAHIDMIGVENFALRLVATGSLHEDIRRRLEIFGICKRKDAPRKNEGHKRSQSISGLASPPPHQIRQATEKKKAALADESDQRGVSPSPLDEQRRPLLLGVLEFFDPGTAGGEFGSPKRGKNTPIVATSPSTPHKARRRLGF